MNFMERMISFFRVFIASSFFVFLMGCGTILVSPSVPSPSEPDVLAVATKQPLTIEVQGESALKAFVPYRQEGVLVTMNRDAGSFEVDGREEFAAAVRSRAARRFSIDGGPSSRANARLIVRVVKFQSLQVHKMNEFLPGLLYASTRSNRFDLELTVSYSLERDGQPVMGKQATFKASDGRSMEISTVQSDIANILRNVFGKLLGDAADAIVADAKAAM